jgi:hypothetical protein
MTGKHHIDGSSDTLGQIESKLREYLTPGRAAKDGQPVPENRQKKRKALSLTLVISLVA